MVTESVAGRRSLRRHGRRVRNETPKATLRSAGARDHQKISGVTETLRVRVPLNVQAGAVGLQLIASAAIVTHGPRGRGEARACAGRMSLAGLALPQCAVSNWGLLAVVFCWRAHRQYGISRLTKGRAETVAPRVALGLGAPKIQAALLQEQSRRAATRGTGATRAVRLARAVRAAPRANTITVLRAKSSRLARPASIRKRRRPQPAIAHAPHGRIVVQGPPFLLNPRPPLIARAARAARVSLAMQ